VSRSGLFDLDGKVAIVTGHAGQLGRQYVLALLGQGASVCGWDVSDDSLGLTPEQQARFLPLKVDITVRASVEAGLAAVLERFGRADVLVNNAALDTPPGGSGRDTVAFEEFPLEVWNAFLDVNLTGMLIACQVVGGHMARSGGGSIVNISSIYGILSPDQRIYDYRRQNGAVFFKPVAYSVAKSGVLNLTRYLATYWAEKGVRVNTLTLAGVFNEQDEQFLEGYTAKVPLGRMAREDEYGGAVVFLASDASSYMTGSNVVVDGGYSAW